MLYKTRGIVFHTVNYSESSVVVKIFTELFGLQSYLIKGVRSKKAKIKQGFFQPLQLLEIVVYHKEHHGLQKVSEIRNHPAYFSIPYNPVKISVTLFLNEILYKSVKEEEPNTLLFDFVFNSLHIFDLQNEHFVNFHLLFLVQLTKYTGFYPHGKYSEKTPYFNLPEGKFQETVPLHSRYLSQEQGKSFDALLKCSYQKMQNLKITGNERKILLQKIIEYYELHITGFNTIKSHEILSQVLNG